MGIVDDDVRRRIPVMHGANIRLVTAAATISIRALNVIERIL